MGGADHGNSWRRTLAVVMLLASLLASHEAFAATCTDVSPDAIPGSRMDPDRVRPEFFQKYGDACVVMWKGGTRGQAGRDEDERRCKSLPGAEMLEFWPDRGSNFNTCIFRPLPEPGDGGRSPRSSTPGGAPRPAPGGYDTPRGPTPYPPPTAYETPPPRSPPHRTERDRERPESGGSYTLRICNDTADDPVLVALALYDQPDDREWTITGWFSLAAGQCRDWTRSLGRHSSHTIAIHARSNRHVWTRPDRGDINLCVEDGQFRRRNVEHYACRRHEKLAGFIRRTLKRETYTEYLRAR